MMNGVAIWPCKYEGMDIGTINPLVKHNGLEPQWIQTDCQHCKASMSTNCVNRSLSPTTNNSNRDEYILHIYIYIYICLFIEKRRFDETYLLARMVGRD